MGEEIHCPVCRQRVTKPPVHRYTVQEAADHFCPAARNADRNARLQRCIRRLFGGEIGEVYRCDACGFGFAWPFVGGDEEFYSILHEQAGYPSWRWEYDLTLAKLKGIPAGKILDIGAGDGAFLRKVDGSWKTFATEGSESTRGMLRAAGIGCFDSTKDAIGQAAGTFDVITMFHVLEHISAFDQMLADCREILRPGGMLMISVPDGETYAELEPLVGCADMIPNHCNKWTSKSLAIAMERAGLVPQSPMLEPRSVSMYFFRASLMVRARISTQPHSLAAKANGLQTRLVRMGVLGSMVGLELVKSLPYMPRLMAGQSLALVGTKS